MTVAERPALSSSFTSTGEKLLFHADVLHALQRGEGRPIVTHVMPTDVCAHSCAFCSVHRRAKNVLKMDEILAYLGILKPLGLKAVIISGGGNPLLYRSPGTRWGISELILAIDAMGLECALITDGERLREYDGRHSYEHLHPNALDALTWLRISMAGLDHPENCVYTPDIDPDRTTLGYSWVLHDIYDCPEDKAHGKVSTLVDLQGLGSPVRGVRWGTTRIPTVTRQIIDIVTRYRPAYVRLLPNCLEPAKIDDRCRQLRDMATRINEAVEYEVAFVQHKPPRAPRACLKFYQHPVLNSCGGVFPCDSVVLNEAADRQFASPWKVCDWQDVGKVFAEQARSPFDPKVLCPGCVFSDQVDMVADIADGALIPTVDGPVPQHLNFV